jgi:hypothetical protein
MGYRIQNTDVRGVSARPKRGPRYQIATNRQLADAMRDGRRLVKIMSARGPTFEVGGCSVDPSAVGRGPRTAEGRRPRAPSRLR